MSTTRRSSGEQIHINIGRIFQKAVEMKDSDVDKHYLELLKERKDALASCASQGMEKTSDERGRRTILLDEPARSLDIPSQRQAWGLFAQQTRFQLIIATHNPFALWIKGAKYIDLKPGYLEECREAVKGLMEEPSPSAP